MPAVKDPVAEALEQELAPLGFSRHGQEFRRHNELDDGIVVTVVDVEVDTTEGERAFVVNVGLIVAPWLDWLTHEKEPTPPQQATADQALWRYQVGSFLQGPPWVLRADDAPVVITAMRKRVGALVREYLALVDRTTLIDTLRSGGLISGIGNERAGLLVLLASRGIDDEFVERFRAISAKPEWLEWIWNYAHRNTPPDTPIPPRPNH